MPEVADVVAVLEVMAEPTANAALVRILTGPRYRIGPRDLKALGRRAAFLARDMLADRSRRRSRRQPRTGPGGRLRRQRRRGRPDRRARQPRRPDRLLGGGLRPAGRAARRADQVPRAAQPADRRGRGRGGQRHRARRRDRGVARPSWPRGGRPTCPRSSTTPRGSRASRASPTCRPSSPTSPRPRTRRTGSTSAAVSTGNTVKLMTVHKAKGLEWSVVALPGLVDEVFPSNRGRVAVDQTRRRAAVRAAG